MAVDTCVGHEIEQGEFPSTFISTFVAVIILGIYRISLYVILNSSHTRVDSPSKLKVKPTNAVYGYPNIISMFEFIAGIGFALCLPTFLLYLIFYNSPGENAAEFACNVAGDTGGLPITISSIFGVYIACVLSISTFLSNPSFRIKASEKQALLATPQLEVYKNEIVSKRDVQNQTVNVVILGVNRGLWIPAFFHQLIKVFGEGNVKVYCHDNFVSKTFRESDEWFRFNMRMEGLADKIDIVNAKWEALPFKDNSVDIIYLPLGDKTLHLRPFGKTLEELSAISDPFFEQIAKKLKSGGLLIGQTFAFTSMQGPFKASAEKAGLEAVAGLPTDRLWTSWIPSYLYVSRKFALHPSPTASTDSPSPSSTLSHSSSSTSFIYEEVMGSQLSPASESSQNVEVVSASKMSRQELVAYACIGSMVLFWIVSVIVIWACMAPLHWPTFLPQNQMLSSIFVDNVHSIPIVMYFIAFKMIGALEVRPEDFEKLRELRSSMSTVRMTNAHPMAPSEDRRQEEIIQTRLAIRRVLTEYRRGITELGMLLTITTLIGWLPYFILDCILIKVKGFDAYEVNNINRYFGYALTAFTFLLVRPAMRWYANLQKKRQEEDEKATEEETVAAGGVALPSFGNPDEQPTKSPLYSNNA